MKSGLETPTKKRKHTLRLFAEAITYRTPLPVTKVIVYNGDTSYPVCPRCSMGFEREYMAFCDRCGQKLNWDFFEYARVIQPSCKRK